MVNKTTHTKETEKMASKAQQHQVPTQAIQKAPPATIAEVPAYLQRKPGEARRGMGEMSQQDILIPRLALAQDMTPEARKGNDKKVNGLEAGMFFNSVTKEIYGETVRLVNLYYYRSRIRWASREIGSGIKCQSDDAVRGTGDPGIACSMCDCAKFIGEEQPECTLFANFPVLILDAKGDFDVTQPIVFPFKSIGISEAKKWNGLISMRNADRFAGVFKVTSRMDRRTTGDSWQPHIENDGWVREDQITLLAAASGAIEMLRSEGKFKVAEEHREPGDETV